jgi:hypothetical protein
MMFLNFVGYRSNWLSILVISQSNSALKSFGTILSYGLGLITPITSKEFIQSGRDSRMDHRSYLGFNLYFYLAIKIYANDGRIHFEYGFSSSFKSIV